MSTGCFDDYTDEMGSDLLKGDVHILTCIFSILTERP